MTTPDTSTPPPPPAEEQGDLEERPIVKRQRLAPLLLACLATMGIGFYAALSGQHGSGAPARDAAAIAEEIEAHLAAPALPASLHSDLPAQALRARFAPSGRYRYALGQQNRRLDSQGGAFEGVATWVSVIAQVTRREGAGSDKEFAKSRAYEVAFERPTIAVMSREPGVDLPARGDQTLQGLEQAWEGTRLTLERFESGAIKRIDWLASARPNAATRARHMVLEDHIRLTTLVTPQGEMRPGEPWSYRVDLAGREVEGASLSGGFRGRGEWLGDATIQAPEGELRVHVIAIKAELSAAGSAEHEEGAIRYELSGGGRGVALIDVERGELYRHALTLETTLEVEQGAHKKARQESTSRFSVERLD